MQQINWMDFMGQERRTILIIFNTIDVGWGVGVCELESDLHYIIFPTKSPRCHTELNENCLLACRKLACWSA